MLGWIAFIVDDPSLDILPGGKPNLAPQLDTPEALVAAVDDAIAKARTALEVTDDAHLATSWQLLAAGPVINEQPRYLAIRDGVLNHLAHHRGQLTVYLRLCEAPVPSIYGPSADEGGM